MRAENGCLPFYLGLAAATTGHILVMGCPLLPVARAGLAGGQVCCHDTVSKAAGEM